MPLDAGSVKCKSQSSKEEEERKAVQKKEPASKKQTERQDDSVRKTTAKRKRLTSPEKRERKRRRDRERRKKKKKKEPASASLAPPAPQHKGDEVSKKAVAKPPRSAVAAPTSRKNTSSSSSSLPSSTSSSSLSSSSVLSDSVSTNVYVVQPTLKKHLTKVNADNTGNTGYGGQRCAHGRDGASGDGVVQSRSKAHWIRRLVGSGDEDCAFGAGGGVVFFGDRRKSGPAARGFAPISARRRRDELLKEVPPKSMRVCEMNDRCESVRLSNKLGVSPPIRLAAVKKGDFDFKVCLMCL